ncbi:hypothetical protein ACJJTC_017003 [Scirpophaga incertulas]
MNNNNCDENITHNNTIMSIENKKTGNEDKQEIINVNPTSKICNIDACNNAYLSIKLNDKVKKCHQKDLTNSHNIHKSAYVSPLYRLHSGSSKEAVSYICKNRKEDVSQQENSQPIRVPKSTVNEDHHFTRPSQLVMQNMKNVVANLPSSAVMPKLKQSEIKRRIANLKFPIVILGKDQLGANTIQIMNSEPSQFDGLDKHIWPFMLEWYPQTSNKMSVKQAGRISQKHKHNVVKSINTQTLTLRQNQKSDKLFITHCHKDNENNSMEYNSQRKIKELKMKSEHKNRGTNRLINRSAPININNKFSLKCKHEHKHTLYTSTTAKLTNTVRKIDTCVDKFEENKYLVAHKLSSTADNLQENGYSSRYCKKWSRRDLYPLSNIIEAILRKVNNGVYYIKENNYCYKDNSVQTIMTEKTQISKRCVKERKDFKNVNSSFKATRIVWNDFNRHLPGFDNNLTALEVKTLTVNEVLIKDCATNIMVQFDVAIISDLDHRNALLKSISLTPLVATKSNTKVFKCKPTILNARLPAEICSVLPITLKRLNDDNRLSNLNQYSDSNVTYIDNLDSFTYTMLPLSQLTEKKISITIQNFCNGSYSYNMQETQTKYPITHMDPIKSKVPISVYCRSLLSLSDNFIDLFLPFLKMSIYTELLFSKKCSTANNCTALALYKPSQVYTIFKHSPDTITNDIKTLAVNKPSQVNTLMHRTRRFEPTIYFMDIIDQMVNKKINDVCSKLEISMNKTKILINLVVEKGLQQFKVPWLNVKDSKINSIQDAIVSHNRYQNNNNIKISPKKSFEYKAITRMYKVNNKKEARSESKKTKKSFFKLYSKCKSASCLESANTPLSKITNLEDFVRLLGCGKLLTSMFDDHIAKKILSSVLEMRNWITEISQSQAMLVLLLANKKDSSNLIRFRPILLQGIAVNRITKVSELDMEIEVIEREHFPKFSQYEGMAYSQELDNRDNLMEEMYWIAKTTASDYQKPFNTSSEKLLKSLLEKRKKLNPSYLRVMARYVGLGLLKPSRKH